MFCKKEKNKHDDASRLPRLELDTLQVCHFAETSSGSLITTEYEYIIKY